MTPTQALLLFALLARHGEAKQAELMPAGKAADREALREAGLIEALKVERSVRLRLTDRGWAWAAENLDAELPPAFRALSDLLARLAEHFARDGGDLAGVIGVKPRDPAEVAAEEKREAQARAKAEVAVKAAEEKRRKAEEKERKAGERRAAAEARAAEKAAAPAKRPPSRPPSRRPPTQAALRQRIEAAFLALSSGRRDEGVRLALLRHELADLDRATLDAALDRILKGDRLGRKKATLMRHDDPAQVAQADRDAAFAPRGEPFHVIWIAS